MNFVNKNYFETKRNVLCENRGLMSYKVNFTFAKKTALSRGREI